MGKRWGTLADAYALQQRVRDLRVSRGEKMVGYKVGCTSATIRAKLHISDSVRGFLWAREQHVCGSTLPNDKYRELAIEGEIGCRVVSTAGPPSEWEVDVEPVIELHHGAFDGPSSRRSFELVSRNCIHAGVVRARPGRAPRRYRLGKVPLDEPITVRIDGRVVEKPVLSALQLCGKSGPLATLSWLDRELRRCGEGGLRAGDFVLAATPGGLIPLHAGSHVCVDFMGMRAEATVTAGARPAASKL